MEASRGSARETSGGRWRWSWINAARYVVVLALTVVILVVIVYAFKVVLREKQLVVMVQSAIVEVKLPAKSRKPLLFGLGIEAFNPSGNSRALFTEVQGYVAAFNNRFGIPRILCRFWLGTMSVLPRTSAVLNVWVRYQDNKTNELYHSYYDDLIHGAIPNAVVRLQGVLRTEAYHPGYKSNKTVGRLVVYCCSSITFAYENNTAATAAAAASSTDRICTEQKHTIQEQPAATLLMSCVIPN